MLMTAVLCDKQKENTSDLNDYYGIFYLYPDHRDDTWA